MTAEGTGASTVSGNGNQVRVATEFLKYSASEKWGQVWEEVPEAELCTQDFWGSVATYLAEVYIIPPGHKNAGTGFHHSTAVGIWSELLDSLKKRLSCRYSKVKYRAVFKMTEALERSPHQHGVETPMLSGEK